MKNFEWQVSHEGVSISLARKEKSFLKNKSSIIPVGEWSSEGDATILTGLSAIAESIQSNEDDSVLSILLPHARVSELNEQQAIALCLPPSVPYQLRVWSEGRMNDNTFQLQSEFLHLGNYVFVDSRIGSILKIGRLSYRIPSPLYDICEIVKNFPTGHDGKLEAISKLSALLGLDVTDIASDHHLSNIKLRHVSGFSASVSGNLNDPELNPVLFSKHLIESRESDDEVLNEAQQILSIEQGESFSKQFKSSGSSKRTYLLEDGEYVYLDPSIRSAIEGFRKICTANSKVRSAFLKAPTAVLSEYIDDDENSDDLINVAFIETSQFSDRVTEINEWQVPDLPFLVTEANQWGTDVLIFEQVGSSHTVMIPKDMLKAAVEIVGAGLRDKQSQVTVGGIDIPVSKELLGEMEGHLPVKPEPKPPGEPPAEPPEKPNSYVVQTVDNFQAINFEKKKAPPEHSIIYKLPRVLAPKTRPLRHQEIGIKWLLDSYNKGLPGVLIADDMGLGKTLQALILLALYREQVPEAKRKPALIIAPTGLLKNWLKEVEIHLGRNGLGSILEAYGGNLRKLKEGNIRGRDIDSGVPLLNISALSQADVVLTTYESLRDYQISFAQVSFGCVVFDEIQKIKNPKSLLSKSAATVNGKFSLGLSGTPVENSLADLWTIMDVLAPGLLNFSLKEFLTLFSGNPEEEKSKKALEKLHDQLLESGNGEMPPILRRMKDDVFKDEGPNGKKMPKKIVKSAASTCQIMPEEQSSRYSDYSNKVQSKQIKMVEGLQIFRKISLSPRKTETWTRDVAASISSSARLSGAFNILDEIYLKKEKVLIFVESREVQPVLATILKERYKMARLPLIINGAISGEARQNAVDKFQESEVGFNSIIISPKAGGVGLTLTEANHVLHLERWWNPAVEDQCNDRAYRIGQEKDVTIYTPVARHSVLGDSSFDLVLDRILSRKRQLARSLFIPTEINPDDFKDIFKASENPIRFSPITLEESYEIETGEAFENYVGLSLSDRGFKVYTTPRSHDGGCDLIASLFGLQILCQIKQVRSDKTLDNGVEQIIAARSRFPVADKLALITNAKRITRTQQELAKSQNVIVICGDAIGSFGSTLKERI